MGTSEVEPEIRTEKSKPSARAELDTKAPPTAAAHADSRPRTPAPPRVGRGCGGAGPAPSPPRPRPRPQAAPDLPPVLLPWLAFSESSCRWICQACAPLPFSRDHCFEARHVLLHRWSIPGLRQTQSVIHSLMGICVAPNCGQLLLKPP